MSTKLEIHELCYVFPPMSDDEFAGLKADIATNGLRESIWTYRGKVIDGRNRARACEELGITPKTREWDGKGSVVEFVVSLNLHRRHLTSGQRAACGTEIEEQLAIEAKERQRQNGKAGTAAINAAKRKVEIVPHSVPERPNPEPKAREQAAKIVGTNARYIQDAKTVKEKSPELHEKVKAGTISLPQAKRQVLRVEKRADLEAKAKAAPPSSDWEIIEGDCLLALGGIKSGTARLVFADPPYNIGIDYGDGPTADRLPRDAYLAWCRSWIDEAARTLTPDGSMWVLICDEWADEFGCILRKAGLHRRAWIKWYESFGVNCSNNFNRTSRHLFYMVRDPARYVFNPEAVSRPSDRQAKYGDRRADPGGKIWDDVWGINPPIPRLVGNHAERLPDFPTQLPLDLLRAVVGCASEPGDLIVDPFNGSGTTGAAAIGLGRRYVGIEKSAEFAGIARQRLAAGPQRERIA